MRRFLALLLAGTVLLIHTLPAQTTQLKGKVVDAKDGSPIPNATIRIRGAKAGTASDMDGAFTLPVGFSKVTLEVSSIGYAPTIIAVATGSPVVIKLEADTKALSEVVVTGVGVATSKKKLAFAVESVSTEHLPKVATASIDQALVGNVAGAQIQSTNGQPGAPISILLRGVNTINRGTMPMILLDGLELGATDLNQLDLNAIEKVEVIQGAAAATIYGAQGANGVIQLFSKKGKAGKLNIDVATSISRSTYLNIGDVAKNHYHNFSTNANNEVIGSSGKPLVWDPVTGSYLENVIYNSLDPNGKSEKPYDKNLLYYDHFKMFFKPANTYNASIALSGGGNKFDFNLSGSTNRQESNFKNNGYNNRNNFSSNLGMELVKNLKLRSITQLVYSKNTINWDRSIIYAINNSRQFANYDADVMADGTISHYFGDATGVNGENPNFYQAYTSTDEQKVDVVQNFDLNYKPIHFLELDVKYGLNYNRNDIIYQYLDQSKNTNVKEWDYSLSNFNTSDATNDGEIDVNKKQTVFQNFIPSATVSLDFQKDLHLNIPIVTTTYGAFDWRKKVFKEYYTYGLGQPPFSPYTAANYATQVIYKDEKTPFVTYGFVFNQRIELGELAGISGGFRQDYSSAFGRGAKPKLFPRGDAYLRVSSFDFWQNMGIGSILTDWKLRAAYGEAGIQPQPFDRYPVLSTKPFGSDQGFYFSPTQPNPDLDVEVSKELEIGTDFTVAVGKNNWFRNISVAFSWWKRSTDNAIYNVDIAPSLGLGQFKQNAFGLESKGVQASLNTGVYNNKTIDWHLTVNFGKQSSEISSVIGSDVVILSSAGSTNYVLKPGLKIGQLFGYKAVHAVDAVDENGNPYIPKDQQGSYEVASNGFVVNKTTKQPYFTAKQYNLGDPNPKFNMSFINEASFKDFLTISIQWDWINGSHLYNQTKEWMYRDGIHADYEKPITINGQTGAWTAFYRGVYQARSNNGTKDYFYEDASFWRLRNLSIGFDFARFFTIKGIRKIQLVLSGRNLITFTKYTGFDPEVSSGNNTGNLNSAWDRGTDHNTMPNLKFFQAGLNLGF
jgi:TonB-linked SusC/RagA family outer membrane protein